MKYKPLTLLELLDKPVMSAKLAQVELGIYAKIRKIETELDISEEVSVLDLPEDKQKDVLELLHQSEVIKRQQSRFSNIYKKSIERLIDANKGLPIHINAWDIHDHNLDIDNIVSTYKDVIEKNENDLLDSDDGTLLDFFTDTSHPVFSTAPYNICVVQLQSPMTYGKTMGLIMDDDIQRMMEKNRFGKLYGIDTDEEYELFKERYAQFENNPRNEEERWGETFAIIQQYSVNDYIEYLHLGGRFDAKDDDFWGYELKDTIIGQDKIDFQFSYDDQEVDIVQFLNREGVQFITVVDTFNRMGGDVFYESTIVNFYDKHGSPKTAKSWDVLGNESGRLGGETEMSHSDTFNMTAIEKVFQWWNSDNDLLEVAELPISNSVQKKLKKYNKKRTNKKSIVYKTLVVRPSIKVVDSNGIERTPSIREIAQHTRRGHWAHYGINGKGKLFGKYTKSVYRKPKTIGKLSSGLVLKDYTLQDN